MKIENEECLVTSSSFSINNGGYIPDGTIEVVGIYFSIIDSFFVWSGNMHEVQLTPYERRRSVVWGMACVRGKLAARGARAMMTGRAAAKGEDEG
ncbi:MAG: hypothetical protein IKU03_02695 [Bacteroidales bacterium]|nr:hypothetical protein [Bacteroidales bacterium]